MFSHEHHDIVYWMPTMNRRSWGWCPSGKPEEKGPLRVTQDQSAETWYDWDLSPMPLAVNEAAAQTAPLPLGFRMFNQTHCLPADFGCEDIRTLGLELPSYHHL